MGKITTIVNIVANEKQAGHFSLATLLGSVAILPTIQAATAAATLSEGSMCEPDLQKRSLEKLNFGRKSVP